MEARKLNLTQESIEMRIIKRFSQVDEAYTVLEEKILKMEDELVFLRQRLLLLDGQRSAYEEALREVREELVEGVQ